MARDYRITFREGRGAPLELWAQRSGTRAQAMASARRLLADLREVDRNAAVFVDGHRVRNGSGRTRRVTGPPRTGG